MKMFNKLISAYITGEYESRYTGPLGVRGDVLKVKINDFDESIDAPLKIGKECLVNNYNTWFMNGTVCFIIFGVEDIISIDE